jgi:hypothetical protein
MATDPATGRTTPQRVTATFVHTDEGDMTELTVTSPNAQTGTIDATSWHPVYNDDRHAFVPVGDLHIGDHLHSTDGSHPVVTGIRHYNHYQPVYDLTVNTTHTYNLALADTTVLVHNCDTRTYEAGGKHGSETRQTSKGPNSAEPADGQAALDNSIQVKGTSSRRVGYDEGNDEYVVLDRTREVPCNCGSGTGNNEVFHGHVRVWGDLSQQMQNALKRNGLGGDTVWHTWY